MAKYWETSEAKEEARKIKREREEARAAKQLLIANGQAISDDSDDETWDV